MKKIYSLIINLLFTVMVSAQTWQSINDKKLTQENFYSVNFIDTYTGYAVGANATITKTTNGGNTWAIQKSGGTDLYSVACINANSAVAVGNSGVILKTTDGGLNWNSVNSGTLNLLKSVFFTNNNTGYIVGNNATILKTTNSGNTWDTITSPDNNSLYSEFFFNEIGLGALACAGRAEKNESHGLSRVFSVFANG